MDFKEEQTEFALTNWRFGSPQAERLVASLLHSEGYREVDPQSPLGGPDGLKDILFQWNGWTYVAAVYFPTTLKTFSETRTKFSEDLEGVSKNDAEGIAFFTNQRLTPTERKELIKIAKSKNSKAFLYHVEAIRAILDSPRGYGLRLEYLRIAMKPEEQLSFVSQFGLTIESVIERQSSLLEEIAAKVRDLHSRAGDGSSDPGQRAPAKATPTRVITVATQAAFRATICPSDKRTLPRKGVFVTKHLDTDLLRYIHRAAMDDGPNGELAGELRPVGVWLGIPGSSPDRARFVPPSPDQVPRLTDQLLLQWRDNYERLLNASHTERLAAIVEFHHKFLQIHPFLDGNGRVARLILEQQARELLNIDRHLVLEDSIAYSAALAQAHEGRLDELHRILSQALLGVSELDS